MNAPSVENNSAYILAFPMHGTHKLVGEGYRTRDGHFIEWMGRLAPTDSHVGVFSRPEPVWLRPRSSYPKSGLAVGTESFDSNSWRLPSMRNRRKWWVTSQESYRSLNGFSEDAPAVIWNPFIGTSNVVSDVFNGRRVTVVDLLDDWSRHYAFESISGAVERAYGAVFDRASHVTANSEKTAELAERFGRTDVHLLTNGCDPERFSDVSSAVGPVRVGYVGKIGKRVDLDLVLATARALPEVEFVFAGPILDAEYREPLASLPNISLLGDVHYADVPKLLASFDVGWVPHCVGGFEVGGDVIKTYEYRAAGLPVLTTPVLGSTSRGLDHVYSLGGAEHFDWLRQTISSNGGSRVARLPAEFPKQNTWKAKVDFLFEKLGVSSEGMLK